MSRQRVWSPITHQTKAKGVTRFLFLWHFIFLAFLSIDFLSFRSSFVARQVPIIASDIKIKSSTGRVLVLASPLKNYFSNNLFVYRKVLASRSLLLKLLEIGGVEKNPGPTGQGHRQQQCLMCPPPIPGSKKKRRKCQACSEFDNLANSLSTRDIAYIKNAVAHGYKTSKKVFRFEGNEHRYMDRNRKEVATHLVQWRNTTNPHHQQGKIPVGCARYMLQSEEFRDIANHLKVLRFAENLIQDHYASCDNSCVDLLHTQEQTNHEIPSSTMYNAPLDDESFALPAVTSTSQPSLIQTDPPAASVHASSSQGEEDQFTTLAEDIDEDEDDDAVGISTLPMRICKMLVRTNVKSKYSFVRILQHWTAKRRIDHQSITELLFLLNTYQPDIVYTVGHEDKLPWCAKTLLKIDTAKLQNDFKPQKINPAKDAKVPPSLSKKDSELTAKALQGEYIHFGLENGLLGNSPGLIHHWEYIATLRRIHAVFPNFLPEEFVKLVRPQIGEESHTGTLINWMFSKIGLTNNEMVVFNVDINIDAVQWFKNSTTKGTPILGAIHSISKGKQEVKIPNSKPFVIGVLKHAVKPDLGEFLKKLIDELIQLQPRRRAKVGATFAVKLRCFCCDAVGRCELKGISFFGYNSCERCKTRGVRLMKVTKVNKDGTIQVGKGCGIRFPQLGCESTLRLNAEWEQYKRSSSPDNGKKTFPHRLRLDCFERLDDDGIGRIRRFVFPMITGFLLEPMHLIDGGVIKDFLKRLVGSCKGGKTLNSLRILPQLNERLEFLKKFNLIEQSRFMKSLDSVEHWKMREYHVFFMYYAYHLFAPFAKQIKNGSLLIETMAHLILGLNLVKGFSMEPVPPDDLAQARIEFNSFVSGYLKAFDKSVATSKVHELTHVPDDVKKSQVHLEALGAYKYENLQRLWNGVLRSGTNPIAQIRNRLAEQSKYLLPMQDSTGAFDEMGLTEEELEHMKSNQTLELPPNFFRRFVKTRHHKYLEFIAFKVRDSFPQNIVRMKSGKIVFCNQFVEPRNPGGSITISGFEFLEKQSSFKAPYNSDKIGFNEVSEISVVKGIWDVKDIDSKCLCLPNHPQHPNPLPSNVLDILSRRNATPFLVTSALSIAYQKSTPSWSISTLLLPGKYV